MEMMRLSFNQATAERASLPEVVEACARHGIPYVSLWRHKIAETGLDVAVRLVRDAGLTVSSVCRGGMFPAATAEERARRIEDNLRAVDEAAALGAEVLVLVCGAAPDKDIGAARAMVADGIAAVVPYAAERGVTLGIEPLHPAFAGERSCITTLREARRLAEHFPRGIVGVVADVYHIWWDPELYEELDAAAPRLVAYHVNDWLVPQTNVLLGRGMMGDGVIDLARIGAAVERAGYMGPIEVEIFNEAVWAMPLDELLPLVKRRFVEHG
ncbi:Xylose isomerase domain-containing protein TIM barrel (plasmid) [Gemmatirosa kalamazoonensis]|uniref:Xylose isomerase domain-containing protein TIM barrel n=1 Tax=Gemmatirosa kalamazoonensis TaxID=861299 RepID=W0RQZ0_9BACT|nr:sugar phosphate isomerase/epimerase family protein [Gemmatirosa kalamazoonensis]AHG93126.1 Xylose isomerase domain-containing protein TIM barrel [Gemmatirosa kalamazoonensis]